MSSQASGGWPSVAARSGSNYGSTGTGNNHIRKLDADNGEWIRSYATEVGIVDIDVRGHELLLSNLWNQVIALDLADGGERWRTGIEGIDESTQRGIASTADQHLWLTSWSNNRILLFDEQLRQVGSGIVDHPGPPWNSAEVLQLAWDGSNVILVASNQILWLAR